MSKRRIEFSLLYRDMWQSSGKYVPRVDQLVRIAPVIVDMGCFSRVETNGGAFEQVNLLFGENPNHAVREWLKPFNQAGIQTHMLERALNGIRMFPVPADVRKLMYQVKKAQGVDIARSFCGLNDHRNLELSIRYAKEAGMISQAALSITHSKLHTVEHYMHVVDKAVEYGTDEICLKDMAGIGRPYTLGRLVFAIKEKYPHIKVQYHGHSGPGFSVASMLEVAKAGADIIDVAMEPLAWGMVHPDVITVREMLDDAGFDVPKINMNAYMEARALTQEFIDDFLGYFIDTKNRFMSSLMIESGLPGGMMGSLMADLKGVHQGINMALEASGNAPMTEDELLIKLFDEVAYIWPMMGYPPLVTPFSQYVKNTALMNVLTLAQGRERFEMIDDNTWDMLLGKAGNLPGPIDPVFEKLAKEQNREFYSGIPQDAYPDVLDKYRKEMEENGWDTGSDDEELFEFAMHETQYRDYKSGIAKERFEVEIAKFKSPNNTIVVKEAQAPNRSSYSKREADRDTAILALLMYTLHTNVLEEKDSKNAEPDIWKTIGFWRNMKQIQVKYEGKEHLIMFDNPREKEYNFRIDDQHYATKLIYIGAGEVDFSVSGENFYAKFAAGDKTNTKITINGKSFEMKRMDILEDQTTLSALAGQSGGGNIIKSPMPGKVFKLNIKEGDRVSKGDILLVIESMKMENRILSTKDAVIQKVNVSLNDMIEASTPLIVLEDTPQS
jgi:pyruvate carboxylase subunit B